MSFSAGSVVSVPVSVVLPSSLAAAVSAPIGVSVSVALHASGNTLTSSVAAHFTLSVLPSRLSARVVALPPFEALMVMVYLPVGLTGCWFSLMMSSLSEQATNVADAMSRAARVLIFFFILVFSLRLDSFFVPVIASPSAA